MENLIYFLLSCGYIKPFCSHQATNKMFIQITLIANLFSASQENRLRFKFNRLLKGSESATRALEISKELVWILAAIFCSFCHRDARAACLSVCLWECVGGSGAAGGGSLSRHTHFGILWCAPPPLPNFALQFSRSSKKDNHQKSLLREKQQKTNVVCVCGRERYICFPPRRAKSQQTRVIWPKLYWWWCACARGVFASLIMRARWAPVRARTGQYGSKAAAPPIYNAENNSRRCVWEPINTYTRGAALYQKPSSTTMQLFVRRN